MIVVVAWVFEDLERRRPARRRHRVVGMGYLEVQKEFAGAKRRVVTRSLCGKIFSCNGRCGFLSGWGDVLILGMWGGMWCGTGEDFVSMDSLYE